MAFVHPFGHDHGRPPKELKELLGGKGANLAEMTSVLDLPVPPGFTITTDACRAFTAAGWPDGLTEEIAVALSALEATMGRTLGDAADPLLVSVRSGAASSMPGMMDTVLNLGLNDASVEGLAAQTGDERFAYDSYRRFLAMYTRIVLDVDGAVFDGFLDAAKEREGVQGDADVSAAGLRRVVDESLAAVIAATGSPFPQDPTTQLRGAIEAVFRSWDGPRARAYREREGIDHDLGTAVNVQAMVFGNRDDTSGTGVGFTRDPATGEAGVYGDFLINAQGEDVVAGVRATLPIAALAEHFPSVYGELLAVFDRLERHYRDMCDTEFTIEQGKLWMLQTRVGKRTGAAALRMAVEMVDDDHIRLTRSEVVGRISEDHLDQVLHPQFSEEGVEILTTGLGASPGAGVGAVCFSADIAAERAAKGTKVILVRSETSPEDVHGMIAAEGILTTRGGLASHAAVVARGWGKPAVVGAEAVLIGEASFAVGDVTVAEGDVISIDGTSGEVFLGALGVSDPEPPAAFFTVLSWADEIRSGKMAIRANADTAADAAVARRFGAEGIGLCRTEHMFLADDRLPIVRRLILAATPDEEEEALEELRLVQRSDFRELLEAMEGLPVNVRLLDPPLHEFLPPTVDLRIKEATDSLTPEEQALLEAAEAWHEVNPMLGIRGVRLGVLKPGLYAMQVRALVEAARDVAEGGGAPRVEVMIPLTVSRAELTLARSWVEEAVAQAVGGMVGDLDISIGTMVETPRAALRSGEMAEVADFFSYGTNDLTQMTFGFSRDDVEARLMPAYLAQGLLPCNPFETLDQSGVGELVAMSVERGRATKPHLKLGVCGEHGGDPASIAFLAGLGVDYVSCSPYRVPIARMAAAQAVLAMAVSTADD